MHRVGLAVFALVALVAALFATVGSASTSASKPKTGGTVVFGAEQEPPCLNGALDGCNNTWTTWTVGTSLRGLYIQKPSFAFAPDLAAGEFKVGRTGGKFSLTGSIKKNAVWNDGVPVTWKDFEFTKEQYLNPKNEVAGRSGWDSISKVQSLSKDGKTFRIIFSKPYAPWKVLLSSSLYPQHALQGTDFNTVWNENLNNPKNGKPIGDGPFIFSNYTKGQSITMTRNPKWWGPHKPYLDKIVFVFRTNTDTEIQAIRGGEVDVIYPQPQLQLIDLKGQSGLKIESNAGTTLEHWDFNEQLKGGAPLLRAPWVRQAVSYAVNRQAIISQIYKKFNPKQQVLQNLTYGNSQKGLYAPHFGAYTYSPSKVAQIAQKHGCTKGGDGIFSCNGTKLSFKIGTTAGNKLRELVVEIAQAQAKAAGVELVPANAPSRILFPQISDGNYQIAMFAWVGSGDPAGQIDIYGCGGEANWKGYCSKKVTSLFKQSDAELNPAKRVAEVNLADKIMALNVPTLPIVQKPTFLVYKTKVHGIRDNSTVQGPTDNMEDWWVG
jgi:peptide/nickel transport system substrate-binding protein